MAPDRVATVFSEALDGPIGRFRCQLVVIDGPDRGRACRLGSAAVVIGTAADAGLALSDDRVSARHAEVTVVDGRFAVRDLGSTNGTWFEGSRLERAVVAAGATLRLGRSAVRIEPEAQPLDVVPSQARRFGELVGASLAMREVFAVLERVSASDVTVLVEGETGTGKELVARALHAASDRRAGPFVAVDCGALPEGLLDSELFGHVKGAFTGAAAPRAGLFARAERRHGVSARHRSQAAELAYRALRSEIVAGDLRLAPLGRARLAREVEFVFPLPMRDPAAGERGFVKGFIDALARWDGDERWFVVDYKSDVIDLSAEAAEAHVNEHYDMQVRLYALAAAAMMKLRDAGDHARRFGGLLYYFLRSGRVVHRAPTAADLDAYRAELAAKELT